MSASDQVWALVSGFPGEKRRKRLLLMFQAYIDDSNKGDPNLFVLAGYVATAEHWAQFSDEWQALLDMRSEPYRHLEYFKMKEMRSPADRQRCEWFYRIIEKYATIGLSCSIDVAALRRLVDARSWPPSLKRERALFRNPYTTAFLQIVHSLANLSRRLGINSPVDFVFDENHEKAFVIDSWEYVRERARPKMRIMFGDTPIYRDDKTTLPLQAADLWAWWLRDFMVKNGTLDIKNMRFPWEMNRQMYLVHAMVGEEAITRHLDSVFAAANELTFSFSVPWDWTRQTSWRLSQ